MSSKPLQRALAPGERFADDAFALSALPRRAPGAHKWGVGGLLLIAGGPGYIGAAALAAKAAGRSGAGIVNLATPRSAMGAIAAIVPEVVFVPLPDGDFAASTRRAKESLGSKLERCKAAVVGPGMGDDDYVDALLGLLFGRAQTQRSAGLGFQLSSASASSAVESREAAMLGQSIPAVVDADALNWLAKQPEWWTMVAPGSLVLTPHVGEMARLTGKEIDDILADPASAARIAAKEWGQVVVLKHDHSVATDGTATIVADDAPVSLATAGTGDVLAGTIGALLAQGLAPLEAAGLALYLGSRAARQAEQSFGTLGVVAGDLPDAIGAVIAGIEERREGGRA